MMGASIIKENVTLCLFENSILVKNKVQLDKYKDLTGFIPQRMNQATLHLTNKKELWRAIQKGRLKKIVKNKKI